MEVSSESKEKKMDPYVDLLFTAIRSDNYELIMNILMVESRVSIKSARNKHDETVFMAAAKHGNTHVFNMLTDIATLIEIRQRGSDEDEANEVLDELLCLRDRKGRTVVHHALHRCSVAVLKILVEMGIQLNEQDDDGNTAMHLAAKRTDAREFIVCLLQNNAHTGLKNKSGVTPIDLASMAANFSFVKKKAEQYQAIVRLIKTGGSQVNDEHADEKDLSEVKSSRLFRIDKQGQNVFHTLAWAETNTMKQFERNYHHVIQLKTINFARKMLNARDSSGCTPLHNAIIRGNRGIMFFIINQGGDINIQDNVGFTPLMEAITRNNKHAIDVLLQNSADMDLFDHRDRTAADIAKTVQCEHFAGKTSQRRTLLNSAL